MDENTEDGPVEHLGDTRSFVREALQPSPDTDPVLRLDDREHLLNILLDQRMTRVVLHPPQSRQGLSRPFPILSPCQPPRRLGHEHDSDAERQGEGDPEADDYPPRSAGILDVAYPKVDQVGDEDANGDHQLVRRDDGSADLTRRAFRLEHGHPDTEVSDSETGDESTHHHMDPAVHGGDLDDVANDEDDHAKGQRPSTSPPVRRATLVS